MMYLVFTQKQILIYKNLLLITFGMTYIVSGSLEVVAAL